MSLDTAERVVAIHQPNFFPWLGYFDKIARADSFVILDDVQHQKKGAGTWGNRVKLLVGGEGRWISAPIDRAFHGIRMINEIRFGENEDWRGKFERTLQSNYARAPYREEATELIVPLIQNADQGMASYNRTAIERVAAALSIDTTKIALASCLQGEGASNDLLVSLTQRAGGNVYMCGGGADGYQEEKIFVDAGIRLIRQDYHSPAYPQIGSADFVPGLSVIDALMNVGIAGTRALLGRSGGVDA